MQKGTARRCVWGRPRTVRDMHPWSRDLRSVDIIERWEKAGIEIIWLDKCSRTTGAFKKTSNINLIYQIEIISFFFIRLWKWKLYSNSINSQKIRFIFENITKILINTVEKKRFYSIIRIIYFIFINYNKFLIKSRLIFKILIYSKIYQYFYCFEDFIKIKFKLFFDIDSKDR